MAYKHGAFVNEADTKLVSTIEATSTLPVLVGIAPVLNRTMTQQLLDLAKANDIPTQLEVMGGSTGTDADKIVSTGRGIPSALLSIPQRNMHTPVEVVDLKDIENTARLMALAVMEGDK